jgi:O-acetyl-ADP-ribose deacetylase (regulator of RNase III)
MRVNVKQGDVLDEAVDVLICTANVLLNMSGGVNGAILQRGGKDVQAELRRHLAERNLKSVPRGTVVRTGPGPLAVKHILHAVGVNAFYESSAEIVAALLRKALEEAASLGARTVATPALATGYGPLSMEEFGAALGSAISGSYPGVDDLQVVLRDADDVDKVRRIVEEARRS